MYFRKIATDWYKFYKYLYAEHGGISSELILENSRQKWTSIAQNRACILEIWCSVLVSVCVWYTCLSREKQRLELCISGWNRMLQPYIESATTLSDIVVSRPPSSKYLPWNFFIVFMHPVQVGTSPRMESTILLYFKTTKLLTVPLQVFSSYVTFIGRHSNHELSKHHHLKINTTRKKILHYILKKII